MLTMTLIAYSPNTISTCHRQLRSILAGRVNITHYALSCDTLPPVITSNLVVFLSRQARDRALSHCQSCPTLLACRSIDYHELHRLFELPGGMDVLIANDSKPSAESVVQELRVLGINHLNYYPYYPGCVTYPKLKTAVTPGEPDCVPDCVETVIDIQNRLIDITTIVEILLHFGMLTEHADLLSANYLRDIIHLIKNNYRQMDQLRQMTSNAKNRQNGLARHTFKDIIGKSPSLAAALTIAKKIAASEAPVCIHGESGTGKELIAQSIYNASPRRNGPFVAVNFAALSESLLESELFGYVPGAFTGASRQGAVGLFEEAQHGTIFLDEIGDAPLSFQVKLLRVLQEKQIRRVGSTHTIPIDVRVISATNRDLPELIRQKQFRRDLYYRLNVLPIELPALRERGAGDILLLAGMFYKRISRVNPAVTLPATTYFAKIRPYLTSYPFPGNIRELENLVTYLTALSTDEPPKPEILPTAVRATVFAAKSREPQGETEQKELLWERIRSANENGAAVGRRSLARQLSLTENHVRKLLEALENEGRVIARRGRGGLLAVNVK